VEGTFSVRYPGEKAQPLQGGGEASFRVRLVVRPFWK